MRALGVLDVVCGVARSARPVAVTASEFTGSALPRLPGAPTG